MIIRVYPKFPEVVYTSMLRLYRQLAIATTFQRASAITMPSLSNSPFAGSKARPVRAPRGPVLTCANWQIEAAYRMIQNNLDPEVAENPDALVVYGGIGKAARNWPCFD